LPVPASTTTRLPWRILVGRIIVLALIVAYNLTLQFLPLLGLFIFVALMFAIPWFIMRGLRFNARVTSYRNVRFDFTGGYWGAFVAYIVGGMLIYGSMGLLAPLASRWIWNYMLGNLRYGGRPIDCDPRLDRLYGQWWLPALCLCRWHGACRCVGGRAACRTTVQARRSRQRQRLVCRRDDDHALCRDDPAIFVFMLSSLLYRAGTRNVAMNETVIDNRHMLASSIGRRRFAWISISNLFATIFTLGLARPWAAIRMASYMATVTALDTTGSLDAYASTLQNEGTATGSEFLDVEGSILVSEPAAISGLWRNAGEARALDALWTIATDGATAVADKAGVQLAASPFSVLTVSDRVGSIPRQLTYPGAASSKQLTMTALTRSSHRIRASAQG
jgi:uncharacterized membrane protein YjgN (DUF898 family)